MIILSELEEVRINHLKQRVWFEQDLNVQPEASQKAKIDYKHHSDSCYYRFHPQSVCVTYSRWILISSRQCWP